MRKWVARVCLLASALSLVAGGVDAQPQEEERAPLRPDLLLRHLPLLPPATPAKAPPKRGSVKTSNSTKGPAVLRSPPVR